MDINAKGVFLGSKAVIPYMKQNGGGSIVNISSVAGLVGNRMSSAYTASKGAVRLFTKSTAIQYAGDAIRANSVHPGTIESPMTEQLLEDPSYRDDRMRRTPIGRLGKPEDVAFGVLYLASDESSFVTGAELVIDGGRTAEWTIVVSIISNNGTSSDPDKTVYVGLGSQDGCEILTDPITNVAYTDW